MGVQECEYLEIQKEEERFQLFPLDLRKLTWFSHLSRRMFRSQQTSGDQSFPIW